MRDLLYRFQQYAHHYLPHAPPMNDLSSWYALMQHHCVPTRLLDWTESSYVAMYFAVEGKRQREKESHSAVWAIDLPWLETKGRELLQLKNSAPTVVDGSPAEVADYTNRLLRETEESVIVRINPQMSNPRSFAQQGVFLCKSIMRRRLGRFL